jgi:hypothetical protein
MCLIGMVKITFALFQFYATTGTVPYLDGSLKFIFDILIGSLHWFIYLSSYTIILLSTTATHLVSSLTPATSLFFMDYNRRPASRKTLRKTKQLESQIIVSFDIRFMVLTAFCCYPWWSIFLTTSVAWQSSYFRAIDLVDNQIATPTTWLLDNFIKWPPDGVLLRVLFFAVLIFVQLAVIFRCLYACFVRMITKVVFMFGRELLAFLELFLKFKNKKN